MQSPALLSKLESGRQPLAQSRDLNPPASECTASQDSKRCFLPKIKPGLTQAVRPAHNGLLAVIRSAAAAKGDGGVVVRSDGWVVVRSGDAAGRACLRWLRRRHLLAAKIVCGAMYCRNTRRSPLALRRRRLGSDRGDPVPGCERAHLANRLGHPSAAWSGSPPLWLTQKRLSGGVRVSLLHALEKAV
jgi:hypothetical protein